MEVYYLVALALLAYLLLVLPWQRRRQASVSHHIRKQKRKKEAAAMEALARQFLQKECIIYTVTDTSGTVQGTITEVHEGGMLIQDAQGQMQAVNLEYVTRIREYPRNKKGKKKSVVLD